MNDIYIFKEEQRLKANLRRPIIKSKKIKEKEEKEACYKRNMTLLACVAFLVAHTIHLLVLTTLLVFTVFFVFVLVFNVFLFVLKGLFNVSKAHCHP